MSTVIFTFLKANDTDKLTQKPLEYLDFQKIGSAFVVSLILLLSDVFSQKFWRKISTILPR